MSYHWLRTALSREVMRRSLRIAALVGTILILVNYHDRLFAMRLMPTDYLKFMLTYCVPYLVATWTTVRAIHEKDRKH